MRQIWHAVFKYLNEGKSPSLTANELKNAYSFPTRDIIWNGNIDIRHFEALKTKDLAGAFHEQLVDKLDFIIAGSLLHDIADVSLKAEEERRKAWPKMIEDYRRDLKIIMEKVIKYVYLFK